MDGVGGVIQVQCVFTRLGRGKLASLTSAEAHKLKRLQMDVPVNLTLQASDGSASWPGAGCGIGFHA